MSTDFVLAQKLVLVTCGDQMTILDNLYRKIRLNSKAYSDLNQSYRNSHHIGIMQYRPIDWFRTLVVNELNN